MRTAGMRGAGMRGLFFRGTKKEGGAVVVEATIALSVFIFAIFIVLSIVNICFIQAKIGTSLASSTKEISQYVYLYYKFSLDEKQASLHGKTAQSRETADITVSGISTMMDALSDGQKSWDSGDYNGLITAVNSGSDSFKSIINRYKEELSDPKAFIKGMAMLAGEELLEEGKGMLGGLICRSFMQKNLKESPSDNAEAYLRRYKVKDGLDGLDFSGSSLMAFGVSDEIQMVVTYEIEVVKLLNFDFSFTIKQCAKSAAWGNGVSLLRDKKSSGGGEEEGTKNESSVWDLPPMERGKVIHDKERDLFTLPTYGASGNGYNGYNLDKNQYIAIASMHGVSYNSSSGVTGKLRSEFNALFNAAGKVEDQVTVLGADGNNTTVTAKDIDKTYKIILVVPDNADLAMIEAAASNFVSEKAAAGIQLTVEVKTGYGSPTEKENTKENTEG